jgi:class 3 adenylate cyclase
MPKDSGLLLRATPHHRTGHTVTTTTPCASCGTRLRHDARFCDACGAPIAFLHSVIEYKQMTVLFADMVHSMDIAAAVGAERLREVMTDLVERTLVVVHRYGGTVDKFTGDGVMALFGAPIALEDHALRACLAALDMQKEAQHLAYEVASRDRIALQLRIGLNSGEVIAGEIGSGPSGYTAIGEQVGMAQRMESVAPPGGSTKKASPTTSRSIRAPGTALPTSFPPSHYSALPDSAITSPPPRMRGRGSSRSSANTCEAASLRRATRGRRCSACRRAAC